MFEYRNVGKALTHISPQRHKDHTKKHKGSRYTLLHFVAHCVSFVPLW